MFKRLFQQKINYVSPPRKLEILEERIVLDAAIDAATVGDQTIDQNDLLEVNAAPANPTDPPPDDPNAPDDPIDHYDLEITGGDLSGPVIFDDGDGAQTKSLQAGGSGLSWDPDEGLIQWTPNNTDVGVYQFTITSYDSALEDGDQDTKSFQVTVSNLNDAPVMDVSGSPQFDDVAEDDDNPPGNTVQEIIDDLGGTGITDPDDNPLEGLAIIYTDSANGRWQYNTGGGWVDFTASPSEARLLAPGAGLRFVPNPDFNGTAEISFRAWDQTQGANGGTFDTTTGVGGETAFSDQIEDATVTVNPINDWLQTEAVATEDNEFLFPDFSPGIDQDPLTEDQANGLDMTYSFQSLVDSGGNLIDPVTTSPTYSWLHIDPVTGILSGAPDNSDVGKDPSDPNEPFLVPIYAVTNDDPDTQISQDFELMVQNKDPEFLNKELHIYMTEGKGDQTFDAQNQDEGFAPPWATELSGSFPYGYDLIYYNGSSTIPSYLSILPDSGIITGNPTNSDVGTHTLTVRFQDGNLGFSTETFTLHVKNQENQFTSPNGAAWREDVTGQTFNVETIEETSGYPGISYEINFSSVEFKGYNDTDWTSIDTLGDWIEIDADTGVMSVKSGVDAPDNSHVGYYRFQIISYEVVAQGSSDEQTIEHTQQFTLQVVNEPPEIETYEITLTEDATPSAGGYSIDLVDHTGFAEEPGAVFGPAANTVLLTLPSGAEVKMSDTTAGTIEINGTPTNLDVGWSKPFVVSVDDGNGGVAYKSIRIYVSNTLSWDWTGFPVDGAGDPETDFSASEDQAFSLDFQADDEGEGEDARYWLDTASGWLSINSSGILSGTPTNQDVGAHDVTVWFEDGNGDKISHTIEIVVANVEPDVSDPIVINWTEDEGYQREDLQVDDEGQISGLGVTKFYDFSNAPSWLNYDESTGVINLVPENEHVGQHIFDLIIDDGYGSTVTQEVQLNIINDPPEFDNPSPPAQEVYFYRDGSAQTYDFHTDDENSDRLIFGVTPNNEYLITTRGHSNPVEPDPNVPGWLTITDPKQGILTYDSSHPDVPTADSHTEYVTIWFFDGSAWVAQDVDVRVSIDPPPEVDSNWLNDDETTFLEDEGAQTFDFQYINEGASGVEYSIAATDPTNTYLSGLISADIITIEIDTGRLTWGTNPDPVSGIFGPENKHVTFWPSTSPPPDFTSDPWGITITADDNSTLYTQEFSLHVENVAPWWTTPELDNITINEDASPRTLVYDGDIENTDESSYRDLSNYPNEAQYSIVWTNAPTGNTVDPFDPDPTSGWLVFDSSTGELEQTRPLTNDDVKEAEDHGFGWDFTITFDDGHGATLTQDFTIDLVNVLQIGGDGFSASWGEDTAGPFSGTGWTITVDSDPDGSEDVTFRLENGDLPDDLFNSLQISDTNSGSEKITLINDPSFPLNEDVGEYSFKVIMNDGVDDFTRTFQITIFNRDPNLTAYYTDTNHPYWTDNPVSSNPATADSTLTPPEWPVFELHMVEDAGATANTIDFDGDNEGAPDQGYFVLSDTPDTSDNIEIPSWLNFDPDTGQIWGAPDNSMVADKAHGDDPYRFYITQYDGHKEKHAYGETDSDDPNQDGINGYSKYMVELYVDNKPPEFGTMEDTAVEDSAWTFDISTTDESVGGTRYSFSETNPNDLGWGAETAAGEDWVFIDPETGVLSANPTNEHVSQWDDTNDTYIPHQIRVWVNDSHGDSGADRSGIVDKIFNLTVQNLDPLYLTAPATYSTFEIHHDLAGTAGSYAFASGGTTLDGWLEIDPDTGVVTVTPDVDHYGSHTFEIESDSGANTREIEITIGKDQHTFLNLELTDQIIDASEPGGSNYSFAEDDISEQTYSDWITIDNSGQIVATPDDTNVGVTTITVWYDDSGGDRQSKEVDITVDKEGYDVKDNAYRFTITEDASRVFFDLLADDDGQDNNYIPSYTYYEIDPNVVPNGVRFSSDGGVAGSEDGHGYLKSTTGIMDIQVTNSEVFDLDLDDDGESDGLTFPITVYDGNMNPDDTSGSDTIFIRLMITNTIPLFTSADHAVWDEDDGSYFPNVDTTDEDYERYRGGSFIKYWLSDDAPSWLEIDEKTGVMSCRYDPTASDQWAYTQNSDGSPDNHMVGLHEFIVYFSDGTKTISQEFTLEVKNDPTEITQMPVNDLIDPEASGFVAPAPDSDNTLEASEGVQLTVPDSDIQTKDTGDEYDFSLPGSITVSSWEDVDYYEFYIDWNNQDDTYDPANLISVADYNSANDSWDSSGSGQANDINLSLNSAGVVTTGQFTWTPNNGDVPTIATQDASGNDIYVHEFIVIHYDGWGSHDIKTFYVRVINEEITWTGSEPLPDWYLWEDTEQSYEGDPLDTNNLDNDWVYDPDFIETDQEGEDLIYELRVDDYSTPSNPNDWIYIDTPEDASDPDNPWFLGRPNEDGGGWIRFNARTGEIQWPTTNADVTVNEDSSEARPEYIFQVKASDGRGDETDWKEFNVEVFNEAPRMDPIGDGDNKVHIQEDRDDRPNNPPADKALLVDAYSDDEEIESDQRNIDTRYTMEVYDPNDSETFYFNDTNGYSHRLNDGGGELSLVRKTGRIEWIPNDIDVLDVANRSYEFEITHHDGNLGKDFEDFIVVVDNRPPDFIRPPGGYNKVLLEDSWPSGDSDDYSFDMNTDEELLGQAQSPAMDLVDYELYVYVGDTEPDVVSSLWGSSISNGDRINGNDGGEISMDPDTGEITWKITNADVNYESGDTANPIDPDQRYWFKVVATDTSGESSNRRFEVKVENVDTDIHVEFDPLGSAPEQDFGRGQNVDPPAGTYAEALEHDPFTLDFQAIDEESETDNSGYWRDAYYQLELQAPGASTFINIYDLTGQSYDPSTQEYVYPGLAGDSGDPANPNDDLLPGGEITFNKDTGLVEWTPNNRDIGDWVFRMTHYDGMGEDDQIDVIVRVVNAPPEWTPSSDLPDWDLWEDTDKSDVDGVNQNNNGVYPHTFIQTNEEGYGLTYDLEIKMDNGGWQAVDGPPPSGYDSSIYTALQPNGTDGGWIIFNTRDGRIEWDTTNADVTDKDGAIVDRAAYEFRVRPDDNSDPSGAGAYADPQWKEFTVTVHNNPTEINGVEYTQDSVPQTDPTRDTTPEPDEWNRVTIAEDSHLNMNIDATDEEVEPDPNDPSNTGLPIDAYYELEVWADGDWRSLGDYNSNWRGAGDDIELTDPDQGIIDWDPNNADVGDHKFRITHHDGQGNSDTDIINLTVTNETPTLDPLEDWTLKEDTKISYEGPHDRAMLPSDPGWDPDTLYPEGLVDSNDEGVGVTYDLYVDGVLVDGSDPYGDPDYLALKPNGNEGGWLRYNILTGAIEWETTNADVTINQDGTNDRAPYQFTIIADDNTGASNSTDQDSFLVYVWNDPTTITVKNFPSSINEDGPGIQMTDGDVNAKDEGVGPDHYSLMVDRGGDSLGPVSVATYNKLAGAGGGAQIRFNGDTGAIENWKPGNKDVGDYDFIFIHDDGHGSVVQETRRLEVKNQDPIFTTEPEYAFGATVVVPATKYFTYDPNSTNEGQHDWRGDDQVVYSLTKAPKGMTIDPMTGYINWRAPKELMGQYTVEIKVIDGNGGEAFQSFGFIIDEPNDDLPIELRPYNEFSDEGKDEYQYNEYDFGHRFGARSVMGGLSGLVPMTWIPGKLLPDRIELNTGYDYIDEFMGKIMHEFKEVIDQFKHLYTLEQPSLKTGGSISPITPLGGHPDQVKEGKRLDFQADLVGAWNTMDLKQPDLGTGGSVGPTTPLEGHPQAVDNGKRLDFEHQPIQESMIFDLDEIKVADILKL